MKKMFVLKLIFEIIFDILYRLYIVYFGMWIINRRIIKFMFVVKNNLNLKILWLKMKICVCLWIFCVMYLLDIFFSIENEEIVSLIYFLWWCISVVLNG